MVSGLVPNTDMTLIFLTSSAPFSFPQRVFPFLCLP